MIKSIDTLYNGNYFRSRMEARWAVFFDECGIRYQYEPEGFDLGDGLKYLPDFYLPDFGCYAEVKPEEDRYTCEMAVKKHPDFIKWEKFTSEKKQLLLLFGNPHLRPLLLMPFEQDEGFSNHVLFFQEYPYNSETSQYEQYFRFWYAPALEDCYQRLFREAVDVAIKTRFEHKNYKRYYL